MSPEPEECQREDAPGNARTADSTSICRASRAREQPSERRIAISRARAAVRASCRLARFAQMITSMTTDANTPIADESTITAGFDDTPGLSKPTSRGTTMAPSRLGRRIRAASCRGEDA